MRPNRHVIVGTAGHVDHGKTELVRALTGVNTDRLREEQERGISIELGFAEMALPSGDRVGLVDVPGHERFVKAMVAGAAGMDLGLLVVAADESVMPQTREHLEIMQLLGLRDGVVAITKCDLVDAETVEIVEAELEELLQGTFLERAERVRTSARTGAGLDALRRALDAVTARVPPRPVDTFFRLPVDRAFTLQGVGLVVTGTAWSGQVREGDTLELFPGGRRARVRGVQVHGEKRREAFAGERVALNLHGFKPEEVERGMLLAAPDMLRDSGMLDVRLFVLPSFDRPLRHRTRVRVHHGAAEVLGRVVLLDRDALEPGAAAPAQLRLESPLATERGDRIVLRFYSPMRTLGGATVLDPHPAKHRRFRDDVLDALRLQESGDDTALVRDRLQRAGIAGATAAELEAARIVAPERLRAILEALAARGEVTTAGGVYYATPVLDATLRDVRAQAQRHQQSNTLAWGIGRAELQERLGHPGPRGRFNDLLEVLARRAASDGGEPLHLRPDAVRVGSAERDLDAADRERLQALEAHLRDAGSTPPSPAEIQEALRLGERFAACVSLLEEEGRIVRVTESLLYHREALAGIEAGIREFLGTHEIMRMADFKTLTGLSRKYAVPLLEYFDRRGLTRRDGDVRRAGPQLTAADAPSRDT